MFATLRLRLNDLFIRWALRVRPPEPTPVHLGQRRIYVLPTRAGLLYAVSLLVMLIGAINYNLSLGYALVFLLAGLGVTTLLHTFRNLAGLRLTLGAAAPVFAGEPALFPVILHNTDARARSLLRLQLPQQPAVPTDLAGHDDSRVLLPWPTTQRGWCDLPRITLDSVWPLGLVRAWAYAAPAARCLVYPHPANAVSPAPTFGGQAGGHRPSDSGDEDFAGLRRHQPSDAPHHVAWKAAARQDASAPLQTKQFAGSAAQSLWLDWAALPPGMDDETRLAVLARGVLDAAADGLSWGLRLPGEEVALGHDSAHVHACLKALALYGQ